ncbi:muconolactone Delta-isomerase [Leucobacter sp. Z1108]|uniref:muconolactone Delta-isomerase n=1 Tax=Leucobacter sp. Z1108 TaxID=3439066 RepID=UPI003F332F8F
MLYMLTSEVSRPAGIGDAEWDSLLTAEFEYGVGCRKRGNLLEIWRIAGRYAAVSIWNADDHEHFHGLVAGLPLFPYARFTVTPLVEHPSTARLREQVADVKADIRIAHSAQSLP